MKRHLQTSLAVLLLALAPTAACSGKKDAPAGNFKPAPELELVQLGGEDFDLASYRGRVVLLNMWATWCKPCREELPELARLHRELEPRGLTVVGVNVDVARLRRKVGRMVEDFQLPFPVVLDPKNESVPKFEVVGYPTTFVIGKDGTIRWRRDGMIFENDEELAGVLEAALAE